MEFVVHSLSKLLVNENVFQKVERLKPSLKFNLGVLAHPIGLAKNCCCFLMFGLSRWGYLTLHIASRVEDNMGNSTTMGRRCDLENNLRDFEKHSSF